MAAPPDRPSSHGARPAGAVAEAAGSQGLVPSEVVDMPANNHSPVFIRT